MARIRSVKPEFWVDRSFVRKVPNRDARMLYMALWNLADEHARLMGDPAYIKGQAFPYAEDDDLTPKVIDALLDVLADAGRVVRYEVDGDPYLFLPRLAKHQRLESAKVPSRLPPPPDPDDPAPRADKSARDADEAARHTESGSRQENAQVMLPSESRADKSARRADESAPGADESALLYVAGSRLQVAGTYGADAALFDPPPSEASAASPRAESGAEQIEANAGTLLGEWLKHRANNRPPKNVIGQVGKQLKSLLAEGIPIEVLREAFVAWNAKGVAPSALPSFVNQVQTQYERTSNIVPFPPGGQAASYRPSTADQRVAQARAVGAQLQAQLESGALQL